MTAARQGRSNLQRQRPSALHVQLDDHLRGRLLLPSGWLLAISPAIRAVYAHLVVQHGAGRRRQLAWERAGAGAMR